MRIQTQLTSAIVTLLAAMVCIPVSVRAAGCDVRGTLFTTLVATNVAAVGTNSIAQIGGIRIGASTANGDVVVSNGTAAAGDQTQAQTRSPADPSSGTVEQSREVTTCTTGAAVAANNSSAHIGWEPLVVSRFNGTATSIATNVAVAATQTNSRIQMEGLAITPAATGALSKSSGAPGPMPPRDGPPAAAPSAPVSGTGVGPSTVGSGSISTDLEE